MPTLRSPFAAVLLTLCTVLPVVSPAAEDDQAQGHLQPLNSIVAIVNDSIVVSSELDAAVKTIAEQLEAKGTQPPPADVLRKQVLERLVLENLQLQLAAANGMSIDDSTLNEELQNLARRNNMALSEFRAVLERDGASYDAFREELRKQLLIQEMRRQMVASHIKVSDQEVDNTMAMMKASGKGDVEYHLSHILVAIPEAASPEQIQAAEKRANGILKRLQSGADFTGVAIAESDSQNALEGGDLGWRSISQVPELFVEPLRQLQAGDLSGLIRSPGGFHIIKLVEKRGDERHIMRQTRARHILLKTDALHSSDENRVRIEQLRQRLVAGEDFATLARAHSQDTMTAAHGGDLGWLSPGESIPQFEEAMDKLEPGELSGPVETRFGWHLIQVLEYRDRDNTEEFERNRVRNLIRGRKYDEELLLWLRRLRDEAYVEYRLEEN